MKNRAWPTRPRSGLVESTGQSRSWRPVAVFLPNACPSLHESPRSPPKTTGNHCFINNFQTTPSAIPTFLGYPETIASEHRLGPFPVTIRATACHQSGSRAIPRIVPFGQRSLCKSISYGSLSASLSHPGAPARPAVKPQNPALFLLRLANLSHPNRTIRHLPPQRPFLPRQRIADSMAAHPKSRGINTRSKRNGLPQIPDFFKASW